MGTGTHKEGSFNTTTKEAIVEKLKWKVFKKTWDAAAKQLRGEKARRNYYVESCKKHTETGCRLEDRNPPPT